MIIQVLLLVLSVGSAESAAEFPDTHRQAAEELVVLSRAEKAMEPMFVQVREMLKKQIASSNVPPDKQPIVQNYMSKVLDLTERELRWEALKEDVIGIYLEVFTEPELRELIAFYNTPIGQKSLERMPMVMQRSMALSQEKLKKILPQLQELSQQMAEKLKAQP